MNQAPKVTPPQNRGEKKSEKRLHEEFNDLTGQQTEEKNRVHHAKVAEKVRRTLQGGHPEKAGTSGI